MEEEEEEEEEEEDVEEVEVKKVEEKVEDVDKVLLRDQFALFSKFGDKASDGETIKLSQSDKWFKQVKQIKDFMITMGGRNGEVQK